MSIRSGSTLPSADEDPTQPGALRWRQGAAPADSRLPLHPPRRALERSASASLLSPPPPRRPEPSSLGNPSSRQPALLAKRERPCASKS